MHESRKIFLTDAEPICILATYEDHEDANKTALKTYDETLAVDDYIVVPSATRHEMTVMKIVEVGVEPNLDSNSKIDWVIGKIDRTPYEKLLSQEGDFLSRARKAEKKRKKEQMREDFLAGMEDEDLKMLPSKIEATE